MSTTYIVNLKIIKSFFLLNLVLLLFLGCAKDDDNPSTNTASGTFTDTRDQATYEYVEIGNQIWMTENLAYKASSNCAAYNNNESNIGIYGYLYSWETAQTVAPDGWHLPTQAEWQTLVDYLGGTGQAYNKLLESGTAHWDSPNTGTNESEFTALPSGYFDQRDNSFNSLGNLTMFHSTTEYSGNTTSATGLILNPNYKEDLIEGRPKMLWLPIRCIKD